MIRTGFTGDRRMSSINCRSNPKAVLLSIRPLARTKNTPVARCSVVASSRRFASTPWDGVDARGSVRGSGVCALPITVPVTAEERDKTGR
jgi:hypothetical protein